MNKSKNDEPSRRRMILARIVENHSSGEGHENYTPCIAGVVDGKAFNDLMIG